MPINVNDLKNKFGQNAGTIPKKPPLTGNTKKKDEDPFFEDEVENVGEDPKIIMQKRKLINALFDDNKDLPMEEILTSYFTTGDGKKLGKTVSPLKGIREGLEDMLNIQQLADLVMGFKNMRKPSNKKEEEEEDMNDTNSMLTMLPFLQKMQNGGLDVSKIDPMMLMMAMGMGGGNQKSNNNMGQLFLMMSMANMFAQQPQPQPQKAPNGSYVTPQQQGGISPEMIKALWQELQNVMQSQQKPQFNAMELLMIDAIKKSNTPQNNQNIEILLDKFNTMMQNNQTQQLAVIMERQNDRFERGMQVIAQALNRENPEERMMSNFKMFKEMQGEQRQMTESEMNYKLKDKELQLQDYARRDMLDREERDKDRDIARSDRIFQTANIVLDKVIGNGLGNFVKDVMNARNSSGERRGRAGNETQQNYDPSLLDDLYKK